MPHDKKDYIKIAKILRNAKPVQGVHTGLLYAHAASHEMLGESNEILDDITEINDAINKAKAEVAS